MTEVSLSERAISASEESKREVVVIMSMGDANAYYHIKPVSQIPWVNCVWVLRPDGLVRRGVIAKTRFLEIPGARIWTKLWNIYRDAVRLGKRDQVVAFVSFFAVPYGLIAVLAGLRTGKPVHVGFVGSDWYRILATPAGCIFDAFLRRAKLVTVTGTTMKGEIVARGYPESRVQYLPHAVDVEAFEALAEERRDFDILFVGALISRKRIDLILHAIAVLGREALPVKACIVGAGPLRAALEELRDGLSLSATVEFAGYQDRPARFFGRAKVVVVVSDMEGFPFAIVEGIVAGAVPVSTDVGTVRDFIQHDVNGVIVPCGDVTALACELRSLLTDEQRYARIRERVLAMRGQFDMKNVTTLWDHWLRAMDA